MSEHEGQVVSDFTSEDSRAECSCGWKGPEGRTLKQAREDLRDHYDAAGIP